MLTLCVKIIVVGHRQYRSYIETSKGCFYLMFCYDTSFFILDDLKLSTSIWRIDRLGNSEVIPCQRMMCLSWKKWKLSFKSCRKLLRQNDKNHSITHLNENCACILIILVSKFDLQIVSVRIRRASPEWSARSWSTSVVLELTTAIETPSAWTPSNRTPAFAGRATPISMSSETLADGARRSRPMTDASLVIYLQTI